MSRERAERIAAIAVWAAGVALWATFGWWQICAAVFALHFAELLAKGFAVGRRAGLPIAKVVILTLIFGYTWWLPLNKKLKAEGR